MAFVPKPCRPLVAPSRRPDSSVPPDLSFALGLRLLPPANFTVGGQRGDGTGPRARHGPHLAWAQRWDRAGTRVRTLRQRTDPRGDYEDDRAQRHVGPKGQV